MNEDQKWIEEQNWTERKEFFDKNGYLVIENLITQEEVNYYRNIYDELLSNNVNASSHRHDLGSHVARKDEKNENICQIMWPSKFIERLDRGPLHSRASQTVKLLLGEDMSFDFDMLISKAPHTNTKTPAHQDESYWLDMPDKRAVTVWVAIDDATIDKGCMWFAPGSHLKPIRPHKPAAEGHHVLCCEASESEMTPVPIKAGSCTLHGGRTIHYTRGNTTNFHRRAFIVNFRPESMVKWERDHGFDHGKEKGVKDILDGDKEQSQHS